MPTISEGTPLVLIDWDAAVTDLDHSVLSASDSERRILRIVASLAIWHTVSLRDAIPASISATCT